MATSNSDQVALQTVVGNQYAEGNRDINAKSRLDYFTQIVSAGYNATTDTIVLAKLPKGARILRGALVGPANAGSSTLSVGIDQALTTGSGGVVTIAAGAAALLVATSTASAYNIPFAATYALGAGAVTTAPTNVYATIGGAALTVGSHITGWIEYAVN